MNRGALIVKGTDTLNNSISPRHKGA
jgi:hypothetical protein